MTIPLFLHPLPSQLEDKARSELRQQDDYEENSRSIENPRIFTILSRYLKHSIEIFDFDGNKRLFTGQNQTAAKFIRLFRDEGGIYYPVLQVRKSLFRKSYTN